MKARRIALTIVALATLTAARAHRLDEYLQATFIAVEKDQVRADLFLTPGIAVLPTVLAEIDTDGNGECSPAEQRSYAARVLKDLSIALNGTPLALDLVSIEFPSAEELRDGRGDIHLELTAKLPGSARPAARLRFENRHLNGIAAYQVNCLASREASIRIGDQRRDSLQSTWEVDLTFAR